VLRRLKYGVKYGVLGAVLAGVVTVPVVWNSVDKSVDLVVDGHPTVVHTTAADVGQLLAARGIHVDDHDLVAPTPAAALHDDEQVVLRRGRLLHLDVDGVQKDVWTTAPTVQEAIVQLGYGYHDFVSVARSQQLPLTPSDVSIRTPKTVTVVRDGVQRRVTTTDRTVGEVLADLEIATGHGTRVTPGVGAALADHQRILVQQVTHRRTTRLQKVPFPRRTLRSSTMLRGVTQLVHPGRPGLARVSYSVVYLDGRRVGTTRTGATVVRRPVAQLTRIGTEHLPKILAAPGGGMISGVDATPAQAQAIARAMLGPRGWSDQWACLLTMWTHESSWRFDATNPSSGSYGIPQALPGIKMASVGSDWQTDATTQITWGLQYIAERYGDPCNAWALWEEHGGWY
jgi:resuscitation-promoting factor RpfB